MKKLEIELFRYKTLVFGRVIHQDESLRNVESIAEYDGFEICSVSSPALTYEELFIRGDDTTEDYRAFSSSFDTVEDAIGICKKIKICVDKINGEYIEDEDEDEVVRVI